MVYHPRLLFFLWKVSNPGLVFFLWMVSNPGLVFFLWMVSNPVSLHQNLQEDFIRYKRYQLLFIGFTYEFLSLVPQELILVTAPKFARGEGGTKVISISLCLYLVSSLVLQEILVMTPKLQEDWLGTKDEIGSSNVHLYSSNLHLDLVRQEIILVTAPKLQEDGSGTNTGNVY